MLFTTPIALAAVLKDPLVFNVYPSGKIRLL
jgi:hypothetical protein